MVFGIQLWLLTCGTLCSPVLLCATLCYPVVLPCVTLWCCPVLPCGVTLWCYTVVSPYVTLWCYPVLHCGVTLSYPVVLPCVYPVLPCVPLCSPVNLVAMVLVVCQLSRDVIGYDNNKTMASNE